MKNPMEWQLEKRLSERAVAIGREGNAATFGELVELLKSSSAAVQFIEEAMRIAADQAEHRCQRCHARIAADAYARSQQAFQRPFCGRCFDEVFLEQRNFETQVELNKTIQARDGTVVQSKLTFVMDNSAKTVNNTTQF